MAEMAVAIMVVSLPSMRGFLRRGGMFSSNKTSSSESRSKFGPRTPLSGSSGFVRPSIRSKHRARVQIDEDSGSEVELNTMSRKDVIYETRRVSVQFSRPLDDGDERCEKLS